jgi:hypothetical protein
MGRLRFTLAGLMGAVLVAAIGLAALRNPTESWAGEMLLLTCGTLALAVVGAIVRHGTRRTWWLGFGLFGWGYLVLSGSGSDAASSALLTTRMLEILGAQLGIPLRPRGGCFSACMAGQALDPSFSQIGHCLWALAAASLGGILAGLLFGRPGVHPAEVRSEPDETSRPPGNRWLLPAVVGLVILILLSAIATIGADPGASLWAGLAFALTWAFSRLAILGAILGRGRRRELWLGAALFGAGYTALVFSRPADRPPRTHLAVEPILSGLRAGFAPIAQHLSLPSARILEALDRPIPMHFPDETPLRAVLDHIKRATSSPSHPGIPIYVDPIGLQEAERSLHSTVQIDLEGIPLRETLRLGLAQLGLTYEVKEGYLRITSEDQDLSPSLDDPSSIAGHCLLALLAAGLGAALVPLVAESRAHPTASTGAP